MLDTIKIKTKQLAMKIDSFSIENGQVTGMFMAVAASVVGIAAVSTLLTGGAPILGATLIASGLISSTSSLITVAMTSTLIGQGIGLTYMALSKSREELKGSYHNIITNGPDCITLTYSNGNHRDLSHEKFLEMAASGVLAKHYEGSTITITKYDSKTQTYPQKNYTVNSSFNLEKAAIITNVDNQMDKIRRILFKNTKNMDLAKELDQEINPVINKPNKISQMIQKIRGESNSLTAKVTPKHN
jgi:hypothetical protein